MTESLSTMIIGGARSGKSTFAERLVADSGFAPIYVATASVGDGEMEKRIALHRARRDESWTTVEEQLDIASVLLERAGPGRVILVDCLTLWLANLMDAERDIDHELSTLAGRVSHCAGPVVLVTNEVGLGIVPENRLARAYRDWHGRMNQIMADACLRVILIAAGLPTILKPTPHSEIRL